LKIRPTSAAEFMLSVTHSGGPIQYRSDTTEVKIQHLSPMTSIAVNLLIDILTKYIENA